MKDRWHRCGFQCTRRLARGHCPTCQVHTLYTGCPVCTEYVAGYGTDVAGHEPSNKQTDTHNMNKLTLCQAWLVIVLYALRYEAKTWTWAVNMNGWKLHTTNGNLGYRESHGDIKSTREDMSENQTGNNGSHQHEDMATTVGTGNLNRWQTNTISSTVMDRLRRDCCGKAVSPTVFSGHAEGLRSINQSKFTYNACSVEHKARIWGAALTSGRVLRIVIEKVGLEASFESI